ncbi:MAG: hypothetical protein HKM07_00335 [Chlamydiae bacterium]|nr:hypothetical protein [Chlamydiota bacterium]
MKNSPKKTIRYVGFFVGILLLLSCLFLSILPSLLSTNFGKGILISSLQKKTNLTVQVETLKLNWFSSQDAKGIKILDAQGNTVFSCPEITVEASLWTILWERDASKIVISSPSTNLKKESTILEKALSSPESSLEKKPSIKEIGTSKTKKSGVTFPLSFDLYLENGDLQIQDGENGSISFSDVSLHIKLPKNLQNPISLQIKGNTKEQNLQGNIDFTAKIEKMFSDAPFIQADASVKNLPVIGLEKIFSILDPSLKGTLAEAIGDQVNMELHASSSDNFVMNMQISSPRLQVTLSTKSTDSTIMLEEPARIVWEVSPAFFQKVQSYALPLTKYSLTNSPKIQMQIDKLSLPFVGQTMDFQNVAFTASVNSSSAILSLLGQKQQIEVQKISAGIASEKLGQKASFDATLDLFYKNVLSHLTLSGQCENPLNSKLSALTFSLQGNSLSTLMLDQDPASPIISAALGSTLDCKIDGILSQDKSQVHAQVQTPLFQLPSLELLLQKNTLTLSSPVSFTYLLSPAFMQILANTEVFSGNVPFTGTLSAVEIPLQNIEKSKLSLQTQSSQISFSEKFPFSGEGWNPFVCTLQINSLDNVAFDISTDVLKASLSFAVKDHFQKIVFLKPIQMQMQMKPQELDKLLAYFSIHPKIVNSPNISVEISPFSYSLIEPNKNFFPAGQIKCDKITLQNPYDQSLANLENTVMDFRLSSAENSLNLKANVKEKDVDAGLILADCKISKWQFAPSVNLSEAIISGRLQCKELSTTFFDSWMGWNTSLQNVIGPTLTVDANFKSNPTNQSCTLLCSSTNLNMNLSLLASNGQLQNDKNPLLVDLTLTPQGYVFISNLLQKNQIAPPFALTEPSRIQMSISKLQVPYVADEKRMISPTFDLTSLAWQAEMKIDRLSFENKDFEENVSLQNFVVKSDKLQSSDTLKLQLDGVTSAKSAQGGVMSIKASCDFPKEKKDSWSLSDIRTDCGITLKQFPVVFLDILAIDRKDQDFSFVNLLGNSLNLTLQTQIANKTGPIDFTMNSPQIRGSLHGSLENGILKLKESIFAQITLSKKLGELLVKESKMSSISSDHPLTIEISQQGFSVPLFPFDVSQMMIPQAKIELGQVTCENAGNLNKTLKILKSSQLSKDKNLQLWFMPIDLHIKNGIANIERTEILVAQTFEIATWGTIDLVQNHVDMILGLTAQALYQAFGINKLPDNYVLQIPVTGTLQNVELSSGVATTKIAALLAWQHQDALGGLGGKAAPLFGDLLGALATLPDKDSPTPPAKRPFPWETPTAPKKESSKPFKRKAKIKKSDGAGKQVYKVFK